MRTTRLPAALATAALVAAAAGCGGGSPKPSSLPSKSASPSTSASPSPTPPVLPPAVQQRDQAGAEAAVRFFLDSMAYAGQSGDTLAFRSSYVRSCSKCEAIAKGIEGTYQGGGSIKGGAWSASRYNFQAIKGDVAYIDAVVDYEPQTLIKNSSAPAQKSPAQHGVLKAFQLVWRSGHWAVGALDPES